MTTIRKTTVRRTASAIAEAGHRRLVVALEPGDIVAVRPDRSHKWERIPIAAVYVLAVKARVRAEVEEKRKNAKSIFTTRRKK